MPALRHQAVGWMGRNAEKFVVVEGTVGCGGGEEVSVWWAGTVGNERVAGGKSGYDEAGECECGPGEGFPCVMLVRLVGADGVGHRPVSVTGCAMASKWLVGLLLLLLRVLLPVVLVPICSNVRPS